MASIRKRVDSAGRTTFQVQVRLKGHPPQVATFPRLTDARKWASATETAIRQGRHFEVSEARKRTLKDLFDRYRAEVLPHLRSEQGRNIHLDWWEQQLGAYRLADLRPRVIAEARRELLDKPTPRGGRISEATVNRYMATLRHCLGWAVKELEWLSDNPCLKVQAFREPDGVTRFLSDEERDALLKAAQARSPDLHAFIVLALSSGARKGEVLGLRWADVDLDAGRLTFPKTKNGRVRAVPVTGAALAVLKDIAAARRLTDPDGLVFPGKKHGTKDKPMAIENAFKAALKDAGIERFRIHDLRHSAASVMVMAGIPLVTVGEILGHRSVQVTLRYSHLSRQHVADAVDKLDRAMFGGES